MIRSSEFIAYRFDNSGLSLFVQKRTKDAPFAPDMFGMFGGKIEEGESPEAALFREIKEELDYRPGNVQFFRKYAHFDCEQYVFVSEVSENFENEIKVLEGEYGRFFNQSELEVEKLIVMDRIILKDVFGWLRRIH